MASSQPDSTPVESEGTLASLPKSDAPSQASPESEEPRRRSSLLAWLVALVFFVLWMLTAGFGASQYQERAALADRLVVTQVDLVNTQGELEAALADLQFFEMRLTLLGDGIEDVMGRLGELRAVARGEEASEEPGSASEGEGSGGSAASPDEEGAGTPVDPSAALPETDPLDLRLGDDRPAARELL